MNTQHATRPIRGLDESVARCVWRIAAAAGLMFFTASGWSDEPDNAAGVTMQKKSGHLNASTIRQAYGEIEPAVCLLSFSLEITNPSTGEVTRRDNNALGLIVSADGLVMTHGHMVLENRRPYNIKATVGGGDDETEYGATLLTKPDDLNVNFLRLEAGEGERFPLVRFAGSEELHVGDEVAVIGVLGEAMDHVRAVQSRRVGATLEKPRRTYALDDRVPFGYVGGPVIDSAGKVVGVVGFDLSASEGGELYTRSGHPLIYQAALFDQYIANPPGEESLATDREDAWLGVFTQPLTDDLAAYWDLEPTGGIVVSTVITDSPAARADFQPGDVIKRFNGVPLAAKQDREVLGFTKVVRESPIGEELPVNIIRDGEPTVINVTLMSRPKTSMDAIEFEDNILGMTVRELTTDIRIRLNLSQDVEGVIVGKVESGSPANQAGIRPGFVILAIGDNRLASIEDYQTIIDAVAQEKPSEVTLFCRVGANTGFFRLQPFWDQEE